MQAKGRLREMARITSIHLLAPRKCHGEYYKVQGMQNGEISYLLSFGKTYLIPVKDKYYAFCSQTRCI